MNIISKVKNISMNTFLLVLISFLLMLIIAIARQLIVKRYSGYLNDSEFPFQEIIKTGPTVHNSEMDHDGVLINELKEKFWVNNYGLVHQTILEAKSFSHQDLKFRDLTVYMTTSENVTYISEWVGFYYPNEVENALYLQVTKETYRYIKDMLKSKKSDEVISYFLSGERCIARGGGNTRINGFLIESINEIELIPFEDFVKSYMASK